MQASSSRYNRMRSFLVLLSTWFFAFYGVWGNMPADDPAEPLSIVIGQCTVDFDLRYLRMFQTCLCSGAQTCEVKLHNNYIPKKAQPIWIQPSGLHTMRTGASSAHYICDVSCRKWYFFKQVDSFTCNRVQSDEYHSKCKEGLQCDKSSHFGSTERAQCTNCVDIRWRSSDKINVLIKNHNLVQSGQCPSESGVTTGVPTTETSADLSSKPSNGSEIFSNETAFTDKSTNVTNDSGVDWIGFIVLLSLTIVVVVLALAVIPICIILRRRSKAVRMQHSQLDYITPVHVISDSSQFLVRENLAGNQLAQNGCPQLSTLDRSNNMYFAEDNEYSEMYPGSCHIPVNQTSHKNTDSCNKMPVSQKSVKNTDACFRDQAVNEYAEPANISENLAKIPGANEDSNKTNYVNMSGLYPNDSSSIKTFAGATCPKLKDIFQAGTSEANYSTINDCAIKPDSLLCETVCAVSNETEGDLSQADTSEANYSTINDCALKHNSLLYESVGAVCNDTEGAYKIMKATTTNFNENTNGHTLDCNGAHLENNYNRLLEQHEDVTNVYDVPVTKFDDLIFKSDLGVYVSMLTEDKQSLKLYENIGRPNTKGNNEIISHTMRLGIYNNCTVGEDKIVEQDFHYVNCTDRGNQRVESPSPCYTNGAVTNNLTFNGDSSVARSYNNKDLNSCNGGKDNPYEEMTPYIPLL